MDPQLLRTALIVGSWLFVTGGIIGSFLNVVVYRLPRRMSLAHPGSRCPECSRPIRWRHNVPVLGWLILRGRCYDCQTRISPRYPLVEAFTALLFLGLALADVFTGGMNLPERPDSAAIGSLTELFVVYGYHLTLTCSLLCLALIEFDGQPVPSRLLSFNLTVGFVLALMWPAVHPVPYAAPVVGGPPIQAELLGLADCLFGLGAGLLAAALVRWAVIGRPTALAAGLVCVGLFLGWQALLGIAAGTGILALLAWLLGRSWPAVRSLPLTGWLLASTLVWLFLWNHIWQRLT